MILRSSPASPFGRKVKICAELASLSSRVSVVDTDTTSETDSIRRENPLGKIPTLILDDGTALYDSRVIVEYLDHLAGGGIVVPRAPDQRFAALTMQSLADGLMDAALLVVYEARWRDESLRVAKWVDHHQAKIGRALAYLEAAPPRGAIHVGHVATACALGYLDLRFAGGWRIGHPTLAAWLQAFEAEVPMFGKTRFTPKA
jgi:glutathione S-transferase